MKKIFSCFLILAVYSVVVFQTACTDAQLSGFKVTVDTASQLATADEPTIDTLVAQGKIPADQGTAWKKIATDLSTFNQGIQGLTKFPPANAQDLITQANAMIGAIAPIIADPAVHPLLALALGGIRAGLSVAVTKLGGKPPGLTDGTPPISAEKGLKDLWDASEQMSILASQ